MGSFVFVGGHGTAIAWSAALQAAALPGAFEIGIGSATLGLIGGGLVAGPVPGWLMKRARTTRGAATGVQGKHAIVAESV